MSKLSETQSLKKRVYDLLDKNPLLSARFIAQLLKIDYHGNKRYLWKLKAEWKHTNKDERGSIPSSVHAWRGWCFSSLSLKVARDLALERGWLQSRARNRWLLWVDLLGRLQWFETGRVNIYCRKPASRGRVFQLLSNGFMHTELVTDIKVLEAMLRSVKFKGAHYVFDAKERLPKMDVNFFEGSNGIVVKIGDRSHPSGVEVLAYQPDWGERNERVLSEFLEAMKQIMIPVETKGRLFYVG